MSLMRSRGKQRTRGNQTCNYLYSTTYIATNSSKQTSIFKSNVPAYVTNVNI